MWHVFPIISEEGDRTTSDEIANFLNQAEADGLKLVAMDQGYFFFQSTGQLDQEFPEEEEVVYEDETPPPPPVHPRPTRRRRAARKAPQRTARPRAVMPDPSIRAGGSDLGPDFRPQGNIVQVDPSLMQAPVVPNSQPHSAADPFGLS
jgi:hypothetical protein